MARRVVGGELYPPGSHSTGRDALSLPAPHLAKHAKFPGVQ